MWQIGELRRKRSSMNKMIYFDISKRSVNNGMNCGRGTLEWPHMKTNGKVSIVPSVTSKSKEWG